jgi:hypothetical protein
LIAGCTDRLPEQDLRIVEAQPSAKLSAPDLWKDFQTDPRAARSRYFGKAIDVSAVVSAVDVNPKDANIYFAQTAENGVRAVLLDERIAMTTKDVKAGDRITLRCFCEGIDAKKDGLHRSCIRP